jgi:hypothetical protein
MLLLLLPMMVCWMYRLLFEHGLDGYETVELP